jgi:hypothetical protein
MASYEMLRRVTLVRTDVSEELSASFIRVTRIGELGTTIAVTSNDACCEEIPRRHSSLLYQVYLYLLLQPIEPSHSMIWVRFQSEKCLMLADESMTKDQNLKLRLTNEPYRVTNILTLLNDFSSEINVFVVWYCNVIKRYME